MKYVSNERGNGLVYILWIMVTSIVICVIVLNIAKVYAVKQQAATATQQAAIAGSFEYVNAAKQVIAAFDQLIAMEDEEEAEGEETEETVNMSLSDLIDEKASENKGKGQLEEIAYINALNEILPTMEIRFPDEYQLIMSLYLIPAKKDVEEMAQKVITENDGNLEHFKVNLVLPDYRIEVKASVTYESITDESEEFMKNLEEEVLQKGTGPSLSFLKGIVGPW